MFHILSTINGSDVIIKEFRGLHATRQLDVFSDMPPHSQNVSSPGWSDKNTEYRWTNHDCGFKTNTLSLSEIWFHFVVKVSGIGNWRRNQLQHLRHSVTLSNTCHQLKHTCSVPFSFCTMSVNSSWYCQVHSCRLLFTRQFNSVISPVDNKYCALHLMTTYSPISSHQSVLYTCPPANHFAQPDSNSQTPNFWHRTLDPTNMAYR